MCLFLIKRFGILKGLFMALIIMTLKEVWDGRTEIQDWMGNLNGIIFSLIIKNEKHNN